MELKKIALNEVHEALGAKMVPFAGYLMPVRYTSDIEEHKTVRNGVGVFDVSHMGEFLVKGPHALDLIQFVTSNDASKLTPGKVQYSCLPNTDGGIVDDLLVYHLAENEYMLVVNASNIEKDWNWINKHNDREVELLNVSEEYSLFAVQGPKAAEALQSLTDINLKDMVYYTFDKGTFAGASDVIVSATGYTGSGGFEIYVPNEFAKQVWDRIFEAGEPFGIKPIGLGARDTLRLEMGFCLYGNDIDDTTSPIEAGLGWITKFTKDFVSKPIFKDQKEKGVDKKLCGFQMTEQGIPRSGYEVADENDKIIGRVTSGTQSPSLGIGIGMAYLQTGHSKAGSEIYIKIRNKSIKAKVVDLPFYKANKN